jgi:hypothetical protein
MMSRQCPHHFFHVTHARQALQPGDMLLWDSRTVHCNYLDAEGAAKEARVAAAAFAANAATAAAATIATVATAATAAVASVVPPPSVSVQSVDRPVATVPRMALLLCMTPRYKASEVVLSKRKALARRVRVRHA